MDSSGSYKHWFNFDYVVSKSILCHFKGKLIRGQQWAYSWYIFFWIKIQLSWLAITKNILLKKKKDMIEKRKRKLVVRSGDSIKWISNNKL